ncbi:hypothetical protein DICVIV_09805 [Dictyocaulus viviparus]|uniref:Uncharacterized protein n=1 Tax=Dictyocaulus viviparus TaxID=29172 RepID=A0A0D8XK87_DICVI|nr:hypothetical protein DICVIV_09805 [Dictyocaulus viviparus]
MHQSTSLRNILLVLSAFLCVLSYSSLEDSTGQKIDTRYGDVWQDFPYFLGQHQKRWANQVRFGKRASNWASSVRFG